jgi:hypothetical protein
MIMASLEQILPLSGLDHGPRPLLATITPPDRDLRPCRLRPAERNAQDVDETRRESEYGEFIRLGRGESLRLLASVPVGRLIFTLNALPAVRPVNFILAGGLIVLRTASGSTVARRIDGAIVAFEADELDAETCSGWSVTVTGRAALVTDPGMIARYRAVSLVPWALGARDTFVTITTELAEGRRIRQLVQQDPSAAPR